ncbi:MAG: WYL domain-containing protein [Puniceicoccaceae bacterium]|nr:MAG: WYL domain-containing protein [Puniceicoccaceae bacterium]
MPKSSNHLALARQWEMLKSIPSRAPGITASDLVDRLAEAGFPVSKRTVERDLVDLSLQFGIGCNEAPKPYGWYWLPGKAHDFSSVELTDAISLNLAEHTLRRMLPAQFLRGLEPRFALAKKKLSALEAHPMVRLRDKLRYVPTSLEQRPPSIQSKLFEAIQQALVEERQIDVRYAPFQGKAKDLRLHPLSLVLRGQVPYLLATTFDYEQVLLYAVHRFESVTVTTQAIRVPDGYSVDAELAAGRMQFGGGKRVQLKARLSDELATHVAECPLSEDQQVSYKKAHWELSATVRDSWELHFWILSQGAGIEVLRPVALRRMVMDRLAEALGNYNKQNSK